MVVGKEWDGAGRSELCHIIIEQFLNIRDTSQRLLSVT